MNSTIAYLVQIHKDNFNKFWNRPEARPQDQLMAMGQFAGLWLASASTSVTNINNLVNVAKLANPALTLDDFLPPEWRVPRLPFVMHPDGTVTLESVDGLDDWGNVIPPPPPLPEPEPEPELDEFGNPIESTQEDPEIIADPE